MKKLLLTLLLIPAFGFAQNNGNINTSQLKYAPMVPADSTYLVVKNTSGDPLPQEVLLYINYHRRMDNFIWQVSKDIEILIYGLRED